MQGKRPEVTTIITITDGEENQSTEYTRQQIAALVKDREAAGWSFVFLGAGIDAYAEAGGIGVSAASTQAWAPSPAGAREGAAALGRLLPFGIGAAFGGGTNWFMARGIAKDATRLFRQLPADLGALPPPPPRPVGQLV